MRMRQWLRARCCWDMFSISPGSAFWCSITSWRCTSTGCRTGAEMGDYIIGACLFLLATFLLFYVVRRSQRVARPDQPTARWAHSLRQGMVSKSFYPRFFALLALVLFGCYGVARAYVRLHSDDYQAQIKSDQNAPGKFPARIGSYRLSRSWNENLFTGPLIFHWAEYVPDDGGTHISLGVSPVLGSHDTLICHYGAGRRSALAGSDHAADRRQRSGQLLRGVFQRRRDAIS